jgi:hypothetical protein
MTDPIDRPEQPPEPRPTSRPPFIPGTPPLVPAPLAFRSKLGDWCWLQVPHYRGERDPLRAGDRVGALTVKRCFWTPSTYTGRASDAWVEVQCDCGGAPTVVRTHALRHSRERAACPACVALRERPRGPDSPQWTGVGALCGSHLGAIRADAAKRDIPVLLRDRDLADRFEAQAHRCAYSGVRLVSSIDRSERTASLERLDRDRGYDLESAVWVHKHVNIARHAFPLREFVALAEAVATHSVAGGTAPTDAPVASALDEDAAPPPLPTPLGGATRQRDPDGRVRTYAWFACGRCGSAFRSRAGNIQSGNTRSCGCWGAVTRGLATRRHADELGPIRWTYLTAIRRMAAIRGHEFAVTPAELRAVFERQGGRCALSGLPLNVRGRRGLASLDRIDATRGYVPGGVQWVLPAINKMKHRRTDAEFKAMCAAIARHLGARWVDRRKVPTARMLVRWAANAV